MQNMVRTTIRIHKDLLERSKLTAIKKGVSLQQVINNSLATGLQQEETDTRRKAMESIFAFRKSIPKGGITAQELVDLNKQELENRTQRILDGFRNDD